MSYSGNSGDFRPPATISYFGHRPGPVNEEESEQPAPTPGQVYYKPLDEEPAPANQQFYYKPIEEEREDEGQPDFQPSFPVEEQPAPAPAAAPVPRYPLTYVEEEENQNEDAPPSDDPYHWKQYPTPPQENEAQV